jgi:hypothetical protein
MTFYNCILSCSSPRSELRSALRFALRRSLPASLVGYGSTLRIFSTFIEMRQGQRRGFC